MVELLTHQIRKIHTVNHLLFTVKYRHYLHPHLHNDTLTIGTDLISQYYTLHHLKHLQTHIDFTLYIHNVSMNPILKKHDLPLGLV